MKILGELHNLLCKYFKRKQFVFRFDIYNGTEASNEIYDAQVIEYEFINQGQTVCVINDGLLLYPDFAGICKCSVRMDINHNEEDKTVYKYRFQNLDYVAITQTDAGTGITNTFLIPFPGYGENPPFSRLIVKSKVLAKTNCTFP
jgi:hypothetical protein